MNESGLSPEAPVIAVVIPAYNRAHTIARAVASVQDQTVEVHEIVIVDDCSTDDTCDIIQELASGDSRIRLIRHDTNGGPSRARNTGVRETSEACNWIAFLDSDDEWAPEKIERQLEALGRFRRERGEEAGCVYTAHSELSDNGEEWIRRSIAEGHVLGEVLNDFYQIPSCMLIRRDIYESIGGMDPLMITWEDHDFGIRLAAATPFATVPDVLTIRHIHNTDHYSWRLQGVVHFIERHRSAILKHHGRDGLARLLLRSGHLHQQAGNWRAGLKFALRGLWMNPRRKIGVWITLRCLRLAMSPGAKGGNPGVSA